MTYCHLTGLFPSDNLYPSIKMADELQSKTRKPTLRKELLRTVLKVNNGFSKKKILKTNFPATL